MKSRQAEYDRSTALRYHSDVGQCPCADHMASVRHRNETHLLS